MLLGQYVHRSVVFMYRANQSCFIFTHLRLREIEMSEHDAEMYSKISNKVRNQVRALRIMLSSIEVSELSDSPFKCVVYCNNSQRTRKGSGFDIKPQVILMKEK